MSKTNVKDFSEKYWKEKLESYSAPTSFSVDSSPQNTRAQTHKQKQFKLDSKVVIGLLELSKLVNVKLETLIVSMWGILLNRYSRDEDVLFGLVSAVNEGMANQITPVTINNSEKYNIHDWLREIEISLEHSLKVEKFSLEKIKNWTNIPNETPLLESLLIFGNQTFFEKSSPMRFALCLCVEINAEITIEINYSGTRFCDKSIKRLEGHIRQILFVLGSNKVKHLGGICILAEIEFQQMVVEWNRTEIEYPSDICLHGLFETHVAVNPLAIAAVFRSDKLTYGDLNAKANQLANHLRCKGAKPGQLVAISLPRGLNMVIGLMAIVKSGAAYVPLDPSYPKERLKYMMSDTAAPILLTESSILVEFPSHTAKTVLMDEHRGEINECKKENLNVNVPSTALAYVIYTSGSTGQPKGAVLNHQGRVNNFCDFNRRYSIGAGDKILALASISFDMSAYDVFGTLGCGACIVVSDVTDGPDSWAKLMLRHQISVWHSVPAIMEMLVDYVEDNAEYHPKNLRLVLLGGDWIPVKLPDRIKQLNTDNIQVVSMGGATEVSMDSTIYDINQPSSKWKSIPYGFPMANQTTYILDKYLNPLPIGVAGELHLGGVGVGEGYLNRGKLTAEKFISNPFKTGEKLYKTGDLARFGEDGNLELLGRIDFQVKIRGFRIELGEIESSLRNHPGVKECVVLAKQDANNKKCLVAYVLPDREFQHKNQQEKNREQIKQWQAVYDSAYSKKKNLEDETFNIVSWNSSYTDQPYSEDIMYEWVDSTVSRIKEFSPKRVLEIGCGTGLLLFKLAPSCDLYHATDISSVALEHVAELKKVLKLNQVKLEQRSAEDFSEIQKNSYDMVILNSIVFDFPNLGYLTEVLEGATKLLVPGGTIFVGDVRNLNTLSAFHTSVQLVKARSSLDVDSFLQQIKRNTKFEEEMLKQPAYFVALKDKIPAISEVRIVHKRGKNDNEMTKFRYDVVLVVDGMGNRLVSTLEWLDWTQQKLQMPQLKLMLKERGQSPIAISNIPNSRLSEEYYALELIQNQQVTNVRELRKLCRQKLEQTDAIDPETLWQLAEELDCQLDIRYARSMNEKCFDVIFQSHDTPYFDYSPEVELDKSISIEKYANDPLQSKVDRELSFELRQYLEQNLPGYMIPSCFMLLQNFPLSPNGKLNRKALPAPDNALSNLALEFVAPNTSVEKVICAIWRQYLGLESVGISDHFIALGGNSLTATQVVSKIREILDIEIALKNCLNPTVKELSENLVEIGRAEQVDVQEAADFYLQISGMSESELEELMS